MTRPKRLARVSDLRKPPPMGVRLAACLLHLGFTLEEINGKNAIQWQHDPPLKDRKQRVVDGEIVFDPDQHDPRFLIPMRADAHKVATFGPGGEKRIHKRGSDISEPLRMDRIGEKEREFQRRLLKGTPAKRKAKKDRSKRKWPSRPMSKKGKNT